MNLDTIATLAKLDLAHLESMRDHYNSLGDHQNAAGVVAAITRMGAEQTQELADSGRLIAHRRVDPDNNRVIHTFTGARSPGAIARAAKQAAWLNKMPAGRGRQ
jgi:hypothetical protein